jgi:hypothetical protein
MHLLGLAPEGSLASPDNCAWDRQSSDCMFEAKSLVSAIEPAESSDGKKTSAEEKDYDSGLGRKL